MAPKNKNSNSSSTRKARTRIASSASISKKAPNRRRCRVLPLCAHCTKGELEKCTSPCRKRIKNRIHQNACRTRKREGRVTAQKQPFVDKITEQEKAIRNLESQLDAKAKENASLQCEVYLKAHQIADLRNEVERLNTLRGDQCTPYVPLSGWEENFSVVEDTPGDAAVGEYHEELSAAPAAEDLSEPSMTELGNYLPELMSVLNVDDNSGPSSNSCATKSSPGGLFTLAPTYVRQIETPYYTQPSKPTPHPVEANHQWAFGAQETHQSSVEWPQTDKNAASHLDRNGMRTELPSEQDLFQQPDTSSTYWNMQATSQQSL